MIHHPELENNFRNYVKMNNILQKLAIELSLYESNFQTINNSLNSLKNQIQQSNNAAIINSLNSKYEIIKEKKLKVIIKCNEISPKIEYISACIDLIGYPRFGFSQLQNVVQKLQQIVLDLNDAAKQLKAINGIHYPGTCARFLQFSESLKRTVNLLEFSIYPFTTSKTVTGPISSALLCVSQMLTSFKYSLG